MKLPPAVWGPFFWHTIHIVALGYPTQPSYANKRAAKEFYESLVHLIPCPICREHYQVHLQKYPLTPHLDRRADLFKWTVLLHNEVNKSLGKATVSELEALAFYRRIGARGMSPVINQEYVDEVDIRSMIKGGFIGAGIVLGVGAAIWWVNKGEGAGISAPIFKPLSF
jgi:hypothetical protein